MLRHIVQTGWLTLILCGIYVLFMSFLAPGFATPENAQNVLVAMLPLLIVATGQTIVMITAGIDLSVTSIIALTSVAGASLITSDGGPLASSYFGTPLAIASMIVLGCVIGWVNGTCIVWLRMPPFIVTLTAMMFLSGFAIWWTQSKSIYNLPSSFLMVGKQTWLALSVASTVLVVAQFCLSRTLLGMRLRAVGYNANTSRVSGMDVPSTILIAYITCGACAAIASILITGQLETGSPIQWENNLLDVIGATVIGGTSLYGGRGNVLWTASGVLLLTLIDNSLNLMNLSYFSIMMAKGGVILFAALLDTLRHQFSGGSGE